MFEYVYDFYNTRTMQTARSITFKPRHEKTVFCICENKDREADQRLCFALHRKYNPYFLNPKFHASRHLLSLCRTWSEIPKTDFLTTRLILKRNQNLLFFSAENEPTCKFEGLLLAPISLQLIKHLPHTSTFGVLKEIPVLM